MIFRQGAGHVRPNSAADPGLVYDSDFTDWFAFICATQPQGLEAARGPLWAAGYSKNASDFNTASIAIGDLAGVETITRKVTNVSGKKLTVIRRAHGMSGITGGQPGFARSLNPGETKSFTVKFTTAGRGAEHLHWRHLTWTGDGPACASRSWHSAGGTCSSSAGQRLV